MAQTSRGRAFGDFCLVKCKPGGTVRLAAFLYIGDPPQYTNGIDKNGPYRALFAERVRLPEKQGAVVFVDTKTSQYWVLDGLEWPEELYGDEQKEEEFIREAMESLDKYSPEAAAFLDSNSGDCAGSGLGKK